MSTISFTDHTAQNLPRNTRNQITSANEANCRNPHVTVDIFITTVYSVYVSNTQLK